MSIRTLVTTLGLLLAATITSTGQAEEKASAAQDESATRVSQVELGVGYLGDDAYRFGRYNGLEEQGPSIPGNRI